MSNLHHTGLYTDFYELTMAQGYFLEGKASQSVVFDYFFRRIPFKGGYVVFAGLQELIKELSHFKYDEVSLNYLRTQGFQESFLAFLKDFRFSGTLVGCREGEVIFPGEPVLRVESNIVEAQLIETILLNFLNFQSLIASKTSRVVQAADKRPVSDFGLRRAQGIGGLHASRAAYIGGVQSTSNALAGKLFDIPVSGTMAHSWVQSFSSELEAFRAYARQYPDACVLLVDTYDTLNSGMVNAIRVGHELTSIGKALKAVRLDSGDLSYLSKKARIMLDEAGLKEVKIVTSNQLNEYVIQSLLVQQAPIDSFGVGTEMITGKPSAALDGVYKLAMLENLPVIKRSDNVEKLTLPGRKKVYRFLDENDMFYADAVLLEEETEIPQQMQHPVDFAKAYKLTNLKSESLHHVLMKEGQALLPKRTVSEIAGYTQKRLAQLPIEHKRLDNPHVYKVGLSPALKQLRDDLIAQSMK